MTNQALTTQDIELLKAARGSGYRVMVQRYNGLKHHKVYRDGDVFYVRTHKRGQVRRNIVAARHFLDETIFELDGDR